jgi:ABC-type amino acid transport substrate-binding protein
MPDLTLAVIKNSYFADRALKVLPENVELVELDSASEYFEGAFSQSSGLVISAESGSAWTLRHPKFTVVNPLQGRVSVPLYYLTANDSEFQLFLRNWLTLRRSDGVYQQLYDFWVLGEDHQKPSPRWCILRDVLHWVD